MKWKRYAGIIAGLLLWGIYAILLMIRTKYIIQQFGSEINAISQSAQQIFQYFILFESGMAEAYLYKMFEPRANGNERGIASLYAGLSISMKKIAIRMFCAVLPLAFIYAGVMNRNVTAYHTAVLIIFLLGFRFVIPYYVSINKKTLLNLFEYKHLIDITDSIANIVIVLFELFLITQRFSIIEVLCVGCAINILLGGVYSLMVRKYCSSAMLAEAANFDAERMTRAILFHHLTGLINLNIDTFLLSVTNIGLVTVYQAYATVYTYPVQLVNKISENFRAGFGVRLANKEKDLYKDFQRLLTFHMFAGIVAIATFITNINAFIKLWIGPEFTLGRIGLGLFAFNMVQRMTVNAIYIVRNGMGMFEESKGFSIREAIVNFLLSVVLVKRFGIEGVMAATVIAVYFGLLPGNSNLVFHDIFHKRNTLIWDYIVMIMTINLSVGVYYLLMGQFVSDSWQRILLSVVIQAVLAALIGSVILGIYKFKYLRRKPLAQILLQRKG